MAAAMAGDPAAALAMSYPHVDGLPGPAYGESFHVQKRARPDVGRDQTLQDFVWQSSTIINCAVSHDLFKLRDCSHAREQDRFPAAVDKLGRGDPYPTIYKGDLVFTKERIDFMPEPGKSGLIVWSRFDRMPFAEMKEVVFVGIADTEAYFGPDETTVEEIAVAVEGVRTIVNQTGRHLNHGDHVCVILPNRHAGANVGMRMVAISPSGELIHDRDMPQVENDHPCYVGIVLNANVAPGDKIQLLLRKGSDPFALHRVADAAVRRNARGGGGVAHADGVDELRGQLQAVETANAQLRREMEALRRQSAEAKAVGDVDPRYHAAVQEGLQLHEQLTKSTSEVRDLTTEIERARQHIEELKKQLLGAGKNERDMAARLAGVQADLDATRVERDKLQKAYDDGYATAASGHATDVEVSDDEDGGAAAARPVAGRGARGGARARGRGQ